MAEVVIFGVVAVDIVLRVPRLPQSGDEVTATALGWRMGGSSANLACGLSSAGHAVRLVGPVSSDRMGDELVAQLRRSGVGTDELFRMQAPSPRALILIEETGERTIMALADSTPSVLLPPTQPDLSSADCIYVESYERYPIDVAASVGDVMLVTSPPPSVASFWPADIVIGSELHYDRRSLASPFDGVRAVAGPRLRWVVVTRGVAGADAYSATATLHAPAVPALQIDATGAGDAFAAGLLAGLLRGEDMEAALDCGAAWGARAAATLQSLPPSWTDLLEPPVVDA